MANFMCFVERTDKIPMNSIKNVVSEAIEDHEEYHIMVWASYVAKIQHKNMYYAGFTM